MSTDHATIAAHGEGDDHAKRPYMLIFWLLFGLTAVEISSIFLPRDALPHWLIAIFLLSLAVAKAGLVAMYYMHLRYDPRILTAVFLGPFVLAALFSVIIIFQY